MVSELETQLCTIGIRLGRVNPRWKQIFSGLGLGLGLGVRGKASIAIGD